MALTQKKMGFAKALIAGKSNKDAAIAGGYSKATAAQAGSRLAKDPDVKTHIAKLKQEAKGGAISAPTAADKRGDSAKAKAAAKKATAADMAMAEAARNTPKGAFHAYRGNAVALLRGTWGGIRLRRGGILLVLYRSCVVFENRHDGKAASDARSSLAGIGHALFGKFTPVRRGERP